ncbi:C2 domain protein [Melia azedarach]|uniref:C2 domain protein n=1 Tax=Melia azedarach TaxID=155640 RepID=A0ACC1X393_MELAZ|nr:C2 domain protein [Melia azedarach]
MAYRNEVEVNITSAKDLKNVNWRYGPIKPYVVVWVDPNKKCSTKVDEEGDTSSYWGEKLVIPLPRPVDEDTTLFIDIVHAGDEEETKKLIGSAKLKLKDVLNDVGLDERASLTLKLKRPSGRPHGKVDVKVTIREPRSAPSGEYYAPPHGVPPSRSRDYPAQPEYAYGYGQPPAPHNPYSAAAPPSGYPYSSYNAAPPPPQPYGQPSYGDQGEYYGHTEEKKKSKSGGMGMGLAVGAVAGVLGGVALSEGFDALEDHIAEEAAEKVEEDLGYDADDF